MPRMRENDLLGPPGRKWALYLVMIAGAVFAIGALLGFPDKAVLAAFSCAAIALAGRVRWDLRNDPSYWMLLSIIAIIHIIIIGGINWHLRFHPTIVYAPIAFVDFAIITYLLFALGKAKKK
jgi:hypothetical protein